MENSFQTSFIPKKPVLGGSPITTTTSSTTSITMVVSVFILVIMLASTAGLYLYKNYVLQKNKEELSLNLAQIRNSFDKDTISMLETYDNRTKVAKDILANHIVLSPLFETINALTLTTIQYTKFDNTTTKGVFSVKMSGIARDYKSIALQADVFNTDKGKMLKDVIFSNLTKDKNNFVTFDLEFNVDPTLLSYSNNVLNRVTEAPVSPTASTPNETTVEQNNVVNNNLDNTNTNTNTNTNGAGQLPVSNNPQ